MTELVVFDLDGTLIVNSAFYREIYSGTLEELIHEKRGKRGLTVLRHCREWYDGKGELALFVLNIPFREWAERLIDAPVTSLEPQPHICQAIRALRTRKVIYTGSPVEMAEKTLRQVGFDPAKDFDRIVGWQEPEFFPTKWSDSSLVFDHILREFGVSPENAWAVGDVWDTDLMPAQALGMRTALVRKTGGTPDVQFPSIEAFLESITAKNA